MKSHTYQIVGKNEREESLFFMLDALLRSRIETGEETTDDEDVNVYLANLLHTFLDGSFDDVDGDYVSRYESDVFAKVDKQKSLGMHYRIYRSNADCLLMRASIFEPLRVNRVREEDEEVVVARGKTYYQFASGCHERFKRRRTGVAEVMDKLSGGFETYAKILSHMRVSYLNLLKRLSKGEIFHIQRKAQETPAFDSVREGRDRFLDAYGDWMKTGSEFHRHRVNALGDVLKKMDRKFRFEEI